MSKCVPSGISDNHYHYRYKYKYHYHYLTTFITTTAYIILIIISSLDTHAHENLAQTLAHTHTQRTTLNAQHTL